ncbi:MAPEG family protein [Aquibium sp. ELW1220]|uniref:MAPEG family protein n=1 Tax=Aquibium sp. ELW1220 TaxID=2976766 RepID=UPI0025B27525|nr:MAPEG family protein [Aquibium sp. ELW1220]MDN2584224.1 MAPEG family protein [Aquibium sp. ELW1220]
MLFEVTGLYALPLALLYLALWLRVSATRARLKISIGDGGNTSLLENIRKHGNFVEWVSVVLILMVIAEGNGAAPLWLHVSGALLVAGRIVHPFGLTATDPAHPLRIVGNSASLLAALVATGCLLVNSLGL